MIILGSSVAEPDYIALWPLLACASPTNTSVQTVLEDFVLLDYKQSFHRHGFHTVSDV